MNLQIILQMTKIFTVATLLPVLFVTACISFVVNDISIMNPFEWGEPARFLVVVWVVAVLVGMLNALSD